MIILCAILITLVIMNVVLIAKSYTQPENIPSVFGMSPVIVLSGSMSPTFETGALIFIKDIDASTLQEGDVICFLSSGTAITHRIVAVNTDGESLTFTTQGDANNSVDRAVVTADQIEGLYFGHIAGLGNFALFMQTTTGMLVCIALPVALYIGYDIFKRKKEAQKEKAKNAKLQAELAKYRAENSPQE